MSEMVERVAKAICRRISRHIYPIAPDAEIEERVSNSWRGKHWIEAARAAIAAMREPTEAMIEAGTVGWDALDGSGMRPMFSPQRPYRAMIDAALAEPSTENQSIKSGRE